VVLSDASGSDAEDNRSRRKKRTAVIGSGSEDSDIDIVFVNCNWVGTRWQYTFTRNT
jgi:hypothetical protein